MRALWTMTKTNCKLLLRSIGFLLCVVLLPVGASALHMVQTSDYRLPAVCGAAAGRRVGAAYGTDQR